MSFHFRSWLRGMANALKPYGLVYDWAINPNKTTYAFNSPATSIDFTATITTGTKSYSGGGRSLR